MPTWGPASCLRAFNKAHIPSQLLFLSFSPSQAISGCPRAETGLDIIWSLCPLGWQIPNMDNLSLKSFPKFIRNSMGAPITWPVSHHTFSLQVPAPDLVVHLSDESLSHFQQSSHGETLPKQPNLLHVGLLIYLSIWVVMPWSKSCLYHTLSLAQTLGKVLCHMLRGRQNVPDTISALQILTIF